jgi:hypothetical protein
VPFRVLPPGWHVHEKAAVSAVSPVPGRDACRPGSLLRPRFVLDNRLDAIQAAKAWYASVPARGVERIRTCEREGLCPCSRHPWRQSGSLEKLLCQSPRGWGECSAGRFASVESPRGDDRGVTMAKRLSMQAPRFSGGRLHVISQDLLAFVRQLSGCGQIASL